MDLLLTPYNIGNCRIENRVVMTAASLCRAKEGCVSRELLRFYEERARGGVGLIIAGGAGIVPEQSNPKELQIWDNFFCPGLRKLTETIHKYKSRIFLQLLHPGAYVFPAQSETLPPMAPSSYQSGLTRQTTHAMNEADISRTIRQFAAAAERAKRCGFDGIELCAGTGYLLASFLSKATNRRQDRYGGNAENRSRFLLEIIEAVQKTTGRDFPLIVRLSGADFIPDGNTLADTTVIARLLEEHGVHCLNITGGWHESKVPGITGHVPKGTFTYLARKIQNAVSIPVIACNRMDIQTGRTALESGSCRFVGLCRPLIADPFLVRKVTDGLSETIRPCISCNQECLDAVFAGRKVGCTVNPHVGNEQIAPHLAISKRILVVGAGIAGMAFAAMASPYHTVTVLEREGTCGGAARLLADCTGWQEINPYLEYLYQTCLRNSVVFRFHTEITPDEILKWKKEDLYDEIVLAVGAEYAPLTIPHRGRTVIQTMEEHRNAGYPACGDLVILGNHYRAAEFATACRSAEKDKRAFFEEWMAPEDRPAEQSVTCVGKKEKPFSGMARSTLWAARMDAESRNIAFCGKAELLAVNEGSVLIRQGDTEKELPADTVITTEQTANKTFSAAALGRDGQIHLLGDAVSPGRIGNAVHNAWALAQTL